MPGRHRRSTPHHPKNRQYQRHSSGANSGASRRAAALEQRRFTRARQSGGVSVAAFSWAEPAACKGCFNCSACDGLGSRKRQVRRGQHVLIQPGKPCCRPCLACMCMPQHHTMHTAAQVLWPQHALHHGSCQPAIHAQLIVTWLGGRQPHEDAAGHHSHGPPGACGHLAVKTAVRKALPAKQQGGNEFVGSQTPHAPHARRDAGFLQHAWLSAGLAAVRFSEVTSTTWLLRRHFSLSSRAAVDIR